MNDYKIHVFNIAWLEEEQIRKFKSDFRIVAEFFRDKRLGLKDVQNDTTRIEHVDEILKLLTVLTQDKSYVQLQSSGKEFHSMCEFAQSLKQEGRAEGMQQGMEKGRAEGKTEERNLIRQKMILAGIPQEQIEAILAQ